MDGKQQREHRTHLEQIEKETARAVIAAATHHRPRVGAHAGDGCGWRASGGAGVIARTNFNLVYGGRTYSVQADVAVTWTKYYPQTLMSPEEPVVLDECALHELIEVLDDTGDEPTLTVGLAEAISQACTDVDVVGPELTYDDHRR